MFTANVDPIYSIVFYFIAIIFLMIRMKSKLKRDFLISVFFILLGSLTSYIITPSTITLLFLLAIIFSFIGDLLMAKVIRITRHRIIDGAMVFGIAHMIYIYSFYKLKNSGFEWWLIMIDVVLVIVLYYKIGYNSKLHPAMLISNFLYAMVLVSLVFANISFILTRNVPILVILSSFFGVILFLASDGILAYNEFQKPIKDAKDKIAVTYIFSQILLQMTPLLIIIVPSS